MWVWACLLAGVVFVDGFTACSPDCTNVVVSTPAEYENFPFVGCFDLCGDAIFNLSGVTCSNTVCFEGVSSELNLGVIDGSLSLVLPPVGEFYFSAEAVHGDVIVTATPAVHTFRATINITEVASAKRPPHSRQIFGALKIPEAPDTQFEDLSFPSLHYVDTILIGWGSECQRFDMEFRSQ